MAESIAQQIRKILEKTPDISNQELYSKFPDVRPNTIRHYKSGFFKAQGQKKTKGKKTAKKPAAKANGASQASFGKRITSRAQKAAERFQKSDLEKRVEALEKKVDQLADALKQVVPSAGAKKSSPFTMPENMDKRIKELEQSLLGFINEKRSKIKSDMSSLDELQQVMSKRITQFLSSLKNRG